MTEVSSAGGMYGAQVQRTDRDMEAGTVTFGGVSISAADAAAFVLMHRTQVMKRVGAERTELAQAHLERIREAREMARDLADMKKFADSGKSYHGRVPVTPEQVRFLKEDVGCSPGVYENRVLVYGSAIPKLPQSTQDYYGMSVDEEGNGHMRYGIVEGADDFIHVSRADGHNRYSISSTTVIHEDELDTLKEEVNNYVDQLNDGNNLFMSKFKNVINTMNESLEAANSMTDKTRDTIKNLVSRW